MPISIIAEVFFFSEKKKRRFIFFAKKHEKSLHRTDERIPLIQRIVHLGERFSALYFIYF